MQSENTGIRYETGTFLFVTDRATLSRFSSQAKRDSVARSFPLQRPFSSKFTFRFSARTMQSSMVVPVTFTWPIFLLPRAWCLP